MIISLMCYFLMLCLFLIKCQHGSKYRKNEEGSENHSSIKIANSEFLLIKFWYCSKRSFYFLKRVDQIRLFSFSCFL